MTSTVDSKQSTATMPPDSSQRVPSLLRSPSGGRFDAVIFDMGSTLLEFENVPWPELYRFSCSAVHERLCKLGHAPVPLDALWDRFQLLLQRRMHKLRTEYREYQIGPLLRLAVEFNGLKLRAGEVSILCDAYYAPVRRQVTAYGDAHATLVTLRDAGFKIGLLSNTPFRVVDHRQELERFGLWPLFDATLFTSTVRYRKPHPEPFTQIAARLEVDLRNSVYVGDRQLEDVIGPQQVGMTPVLIRRPGREYTSGRTSSVEVTELSEVPPLLSIAPLNC